MINKDELIESLKALGQKELHEKEYAEENSIIEKAIGVAATYNRKERRKKLKWLKKQLELHNKKKPLKQLVYTPETDLSSEEMQKNVAIMRAWATRYGILIRKINELENYES